MNRSQLTKLVAQGQCISNSSAERIVRALFEEIQAALYRRERVTITGFGTFVPRFRDTCTRRNPQNGESVQVAARWVVAFKPGTELKTQMI